MNRDGRPKNLLRRLARWYVAMYKGTPVSLPPSGCDALDAWIDAATTDLAADGRLRVANEITAHFNVERDARIAQGVHEDAAERTALEQLGPARVARRRFNASYLTFLDEHRIAFFTGNKSIRTRWNLRRDIPVASVFLAIVFVGGMSIPESLGPLFSGLGTMGAFYAPRAVGRMLYGWLGERMLRDIMLGIAALQGAVALVVLQFFGMRFVSAFSSDAAHFGNPIAWLFPGLFVAMLPVLAFLSLRLALKLPKSKGPVQS